MDVDKRKEIVVTILALNFIPFVISILTLLFIINITFKPVLQFTLEMFILYASLPVLGITTYILSFMYRDIIGSKNVWLLGCVNSGIWCVMFILFTGIALFGNIFGGVSSFFCFLYFKRLFILNDKLYGFEKSHELNQFETKE